MNTDVLAQSWLSLRRLPPLRQTFIETEWFILSHTRLIDFFLNHVLNPHVEY